MTKLATFRKEQKLKLKELAKLIEAVRGYPVKVSQVGRWCTGVACPSRPNAIAIEKATGGKVKAKMWGYK